MGSGTEAPLDSPLSVLPLSLTILLRILRTNIYHLRALHVGPGFVGLGTSTRPDDLSKPFVYRLLDVLLSFLTPRPPSPLHQAVQSEVAGLLGTGLEVFFPDHSKRRSLLLALLSPPTSGVEQGDPVKGGLPRLDPAARKLLLSRVCASLVSSLPLALQFVPEQMRSLAAIPTNKPAGAPVTYLNQALASSDTEATGLLRVGATVVRYVGSRRVSSAVPFELVGSTLCRCLCREVTPQNPAATARKQPS